MHHLNIVAKYMTIHCRMSEGGSYSISSEGAHERAEIKRCARAVLDKREYKAAPYGAYIKIKDEADKQAVAGALKTLGLSKGIAFQSMENGNDQYCFEKEGLKALVDAGVYNHDLDKIARANGVEILQRAPVHAQSR